MRKKKSPKTTVGDTFHEVLHDHKPVWEYDAEGKYCSSCLVNPPTIPPKTAIPPKTIPAESFSAEYAKLKKAFPKKPTLTSAELQAQAYVNFLEEAKKNKLNVQGSVTKQSISTAEDYYTNNFYYPASDKFKYPWTYGLYTPTQEELDNPDVSCEGITNSRYGKQLAKFTLNPGAVERLAKEAEARGVFPGRVLEEALLDFIKGLDSVPEIEI